MATITADIDIYATMFNPYLDWKYKQYIDTYIALRSLSVPKSVGSH